MIAYAVERFHSPGATAGDILMSVGPSQRDVAWAQAFRALDVVRRLPNGWDGEGSPAPTARVVRTGLAVLTDLQQLGWSSPSRIVAGVKGSIIIEWQSGERYTEAEIVSAILIEWMDVVPNKPAAHWTTALSTHASSRSQHHTDFVWAS